MQKRGDVQEIAFCSQLSPDFTLIPKKGDPELLEWPLSQCWVPQFGKLDTKEGITPHYNGALAKKGVLFLLRKSRHHTVEDRFRDSQRKSRTQNAKKVYPTIMIHRKSELGNDEQTGLFTEL